MPCDTVQTNSVVVGSMSIPLLVRAAVREQWQARTSDDGRYVWLEVEGAEVVIDRTAGTINGRLSESQLGRLGATVKAAYSAEVVRLTAARNGWTVRQTGARTFEVVKGGA